MVVCHNISIVRDYDSRTCTLPLRSLNLTFLASSITSSKEISEEILKWVIIVHGLCFATYSDLHIHHSRTCFFSGLCEVNRLHRRILMHRLLIDGVRELDFRTGQFLVFVH